MTHPPLRRHITVHGRRVHYLRLGVGPPAVFVHSSPTNAWYVLPQMRQLAGRCTCFAFDTPGFGDSGSLPGDRLTVADLAAALAENMAAVGLPPCPVYGTHTGAAIALSLGAHHPERVTTLVLDGVPIFTPDEVDRLFDGYFEPLEIDARGGHYARAWTRFRDQYVWFPWTQKRPDHHNEVDLGSPDAVHAWLTSFFQAGRTYVPAYRAAIGYGDQAVADARALRCPVVYTAIDSDMLAPHLDRLPPLRDGQAVRRVGDDKLRRDAWIPALFDRWPALGPAPVDRPALDTVPGVHAQFIDLPHGQVLLRHAHAAAADRLPVMLLHDAPGSSRPLAAPSGLVERLAGDRMVLAPDLPGCAGSAALDAAESGTPALACWADALAGMCRQVGVTALCAYGIGVGASVALALAERHPALVRAVVLRGLALPTPDERVELSTRYAPKVVPQADGSHWYRTWLMLRDQQIWFPWYDPRAARLRRVPADFNGDHLHDWTMDVLLQHASYHQVIEAAFAHDAAAGLRSLRQPLALCHDEQVPFHAHAARVRAVRPDAPTLVPTEDAQAPALTAFLDAVAAGRPQTAHPLSGATA